MKPITAPVMAPGRLTDDHAEEGKPQGVGKTHGCACGCGDCALYQRASCIEFGLADRADGGAHDRHVAAAVAILPQRIAQVIQPLTGQIRHAGHAGMAIGTMAGRAQAQPGRARRHVGLAASLSGNGGGQGKGRDQK